MSKESNRAQKILAELRQFASEKGNGQAVNPNLIELFEETDSWLASGEVNDMLSIVIDDASQGIDISQKYPALYHYMLTNERLFESFFESLEILEESQDENWNPMPFKPSLDLSFLKSAISEPKNSRSGKQP